uniref:CWH43-like N-terminal domain-containing protein n=1 Tax=Amphilophus citrinellus TaxID=61819 RepID=A0A3Q0SF32_AMPCI
MQLWAVLPVCLAVFGTAGIWTVFAVAVTNESVNLIEGILYISQCGTYNLQSCLFSQICNICCFLALWVVVICFQLVRDYGDHRKASISSIVLGFSPAWESQSVLMSIHVVVAILAFFLGLAYFWARLKHILPQGGTIELFRAFCLTWLPLVCKTNANLSANTANCEWYKPERETIHLQSRNCNF